MLTSVQKIEQTRYRTALTLVQQMIPPDLHQGLDILLSQSAEPNAALIRLESFCERHPGDFQAIAVTPFGLQSLIEIFSTSEFLSEEVLQHPEWLLTILDSGWLHRTRTGVEMQAELEGMLGSLDGMPSALNLAEFRRRQILRILLRDLHGFAALSEIMEEISAVADALIEVSLRRIRADLVEKYGTPRLEGGERECGYCVLGLGKLGGGELNYSSDIDLMFIYGGAGETDGEQSISNKEFFKKVSTRLTDLLGTHTAEGFCYRVDLRLRPDGRFGEVCVSLEGMQSYYTHRARDWELQMLIKARTVAGDRTLGRSFLEWVQPMIYSTSIDFGAIESMSETRERISEKLNSRRRPGGLDIKLARGGIRDIEFLVQCLQRVHGGRAAWLRNSSTLLSLNRLRDKDLLSDSEYSRLASTYHFLRHLEHRLQVDQDRQTHTLPEKHEQLALIARRMPPTLLGDSPTAEALLSAVNQHLEQVQEVYERVVHAQQPMYYTQVAVPPQPAAALQDPSADTRFDTTASNLIRFLDQKAPQLAAAIARTRLGRSQPAFEHFIEAVLRRDEWLDALESDPILCGYLLDIFQHSHFYAEQLVRQPDYFEEIRALRTRGRSTTKYGEVMPLLEEVADIRKYFLRQMFRIQTESICLSAPVFDSLARTSELACATIAAAYRVVVAQTFATHPPEQKDYIAGDQMMVVALGRLGVHEFDLGSDADLVFIIPDSDLPELHFWTRVAEKLVAVLPSYTGDGTIFAIDTRLCPNGKGGALVQSEGAYRDYFSRQAEAWEGLSYMKSLAVAGNTSRATEFLADLQKIDWRRYGQSGRSRKELRQMRQRIEKEHGQANPLKTGSGGYYDIDFILMYLRLRGAGMFFRQLNTPARIEVLEQMGHLDSADATFLNDAASFYRAIDHGMRLMSGHSEGSLPTAEAHLRQLTGLVSRWLPDHLYDQPLPDELDQIRDKTRKFFDRLFSEA